MKKLTLIIFTLLILSGCADNIPISELSSIEPVGFLHGLWHGITAGFALIGSLFDDSIAVYAKYNNGWWYDLGFIMGTGTLVCCSFNSK